MLRPRTLMAIVACTHLALAATARADAVADWNLITAQTVGAAAPPRPGPSAFLDFAKVHVAIFDAVQAIEGDFEPYAGPIPGATGSPEAAAAKAAHDVLVNSFPAQAASLDLTYTNYLASHGLNPADPGVAVGQQAAANVIAFRAGDGSFPNPPPPPFIGGTDPGVWRPTTSYLPGPPPSGAPMAAEWLAFMVPYAIQSPDQFRPQGPPALKSGRYAKDYNEVKRLGGDVNSERTQEQTDLANFWNLNFIGQWELAFRDIAAAHVDNISDSSRLFALITMAMADGMISGLGQQEALRLLAARHGHPGGRRRRQRQDRRRSQLASLHQHPALPRIHLGRERRQLGRPPRAQALLRDGPLHVRGHEQQPPGHSADARVHAFLGCGQGCARSPHPSGHPLPLRRRGGRRSRAARWPGTSSRTSCGRSAAAGMTTTRRMTRTIDVSTA